MDATCSRNAVQGAVRGDLNRQVYERTRWFRVCRYGLFVHWQTKTTPLTGAAVPFPEAVDRFPVEGFAEQVVETGAGYVIFTINHELNHYPFPLESMDCVMPGRTCRRDLMGELLEALDRRGVRLMFYHSWQANDDAAFAAVSGWQQDARKWQETLCRQVEEIGRRYGAGLKGWWVDNCRHNKWDNFAERYDLPTIAAALRAGHPERIIAFNVSKPIPPEPEFDARVTGIADYAAGHLHDELLVSDGPVNRYGLQAHWCNNMDTEWVYSGGEYRARFTDAQVIECLRANIRGGAVFSYGVAPAQEGVISAVAMRQLRGVRGAIR
jgi:alpha-L-fucosidase